MTVHEIRDLSIVSCATPSGNSGVGGAYHGGVAGMDRAVTSTSLALLAAAKRVGPRQIAAGQNSIISL